jgi:Cu2+-exporting ATPase
MNLSPPISIVRTVTVLVIACPHALGLAIPLVVALSTAISAKAGILIKDRLALERRLEALARRLPSTEGS